MAAMKWILSVLVLVAVSVWTEAMIVNTESESRDVGDDSNLSVSELLQRANLNWVQDGVQMHDDIVVPNSRNAHPCVQTGCKWPRASDGKVYVPYVIANNYTSQQLGVITSALSSFSNSTCVRFVPRTTQTDYIYIQALMSCSSVVGRQGGRQTVSISTWGCVNFGIVQHEMIHVLGFVHEHSRSDRDQHIQVLLQNVIPGFESNFDKMDTLNQGTPYDYNSVMQYDRLAFSKDGSSPTMVAVPNANAVFGTATKMSQNDIKRINLLYCSN